MKKIYRFFVTLATALIVAMACFGCGGQSAKVGQFDQTVKFGQRYERGMLYYVFEKDGTGRYGMEGQGESVYYSSYVPFEWRVGSDDRVYLIYGEEVKAENHTATTELSYYDEPLVWGEDFVAVNYVNSTVYSGFTSHVETRTSIYVLAGSHLAD